LFLRLLELDERKKLVTQLNEPITDKFISSTQQFHKITEMNDF